MEDRFFCAILFLYCTEVINHALGRRSVDTEISVKARQWIAGIKTKIKTKTKLLQNGFWIK